MTRAGYQIKKKPCAECFMAREERIAILMFDAGKTEYAAEKMVNAMDPRCAAHPKQEEINVEPRRKE